MTATSTVSTHATPTLAAKYSIVFWDHEIHDETSTDCERMAADLGEFLLGSLGGETPE